LLPQNSADHNTPALLDLAQAIEVEHQAAIYAALWHASRCGELLLKAQAQVEGLWQEWVAANLTFGDRQAQKYMRFARSVRVQPELLKSYSTLDSALAAIADKRHAHPPGSGSVEWYTPAAYLDCARQVLGEFDLDPASNAIAQEQVRARSYFTKDDDGLSQQWNGRVWCNPPYSDAGKFVEKLLTGLSAGRTTEALLLVNAYCDTRWFHRAAAACAAICFPLGRIYFEKPDGDQMKQPAYGSAFIYFGDQLARFRAAFADQGLIVIPDTGEGAP
jgi:phage N-6-adenine-methyltransferase